MEELDDWDHYKNTVKSHSERINKLERLEGGYGFNIEAVSDLMEYQSIYSIWMTVITVLVLITLWRTF
jgi:hypothetical protein